jgi:hypothetical protein
MQRNAKWIKYIYLQRNAKWIKYNSGRGMQKWKIKTKNEAGKV